MTNMDQPPIKPKENSPETHEEIKIECAFHTAANERHPNRNEDMILADLGLRTFGAFDGIQGHAHGDVASKMACEYVQKNISRVPIFTSVDVAKNALGNILADADKAIYKKNEDPNLNTGLTYNAEEISKKPNMGTTASVFKIHTDKEGKNWGIMANVGDSRIYKVNEDAKIKQLTTDDDLVGEYVSDPKERERIRKKLDGAKHLEDLEIDLNKDRDEVFYFNNRNVITEYLGTGRGLLNTYSIPLKKGDRFLITSDGIHDNLTIEEIEDVIIQSKTLDEAALNLIKKAQERSRQDRNKEMRAKPDDMSVVIVVVKLK